MAGVSNQRRARALSAATQLFESRNLMTLRIASLAAIAALSPFPATAAEISTHVLDLARGVGGAEVPVILTKKGGNGTWEEVARSKTDANGRVRNFGDPKTFSAGVYKLQFDMTAYPQSSAQPFFPEIDLVFRVTDPAAHYHVPVVVSPYGYSTYRGN